MNKIFHILSALVLISGYRQIAEGNPINNPTLNDVKYAVCRYKTRTPGIHCIVKNGSGDITVNQITDEITFPNLENQFRAEKIEPVNGTLIIKIEGTEIFRDIVSENVHITNYTAKPYLLQYNGIL
ncbi:unnamed protein product [Gordionus sp. m RMFG-2023]